MNVGFSEWLAIHAEDFEYAPGIGLTYKGEDLIEGDRLALLIHRAWDGYNRVKISPMMKDNHSAYQKSWFGIEYKYNSYKGITSELTIQEQAMRDCMEYIYENAG